MSKAYTTISIEDVANHILSKETFKEYHYTSDINLNDPLVPQMTVE